MNFALGKPRFFFPDHIGSAASYVLCWKKESSMRDSYGEGEVKVKLYFLGPIDGMAEVEQTQLCSQCLVMILKWLNRNGYQTHSA